MTIDIERPIIDCLSFVMCPLLAQLKTGFFSIFFAVAVYSTNEANKSGLKQSIFLDVYAGDNYSPKTKHVLLSIVNIKIAQTGFIKLVIYRVK